MFRVEEVQEKKEEEEQAEPSWAQALITWLDSADENKSTFEVC